MCGSGLICGADRNGLYQSCRDPGLRSAGHPFKNIRLEPTNGFSSESPFSRELPDSRDAAKYPRRPPDEASHIMGGENTIPDWVGLIHPPGDRDSLTYADAARCDAVLNGIYRHKRPSMWFRSFRVKLPRMGNHAPDFRCVAREFRSKFSETLTTRLLTHELGYNLAGVDPQRPR
jgi:hypothetical protein